MTVIWSEDKSLHATIGKNKAGEYSVTIYMSEVGDPDESDYYPAIGINKFTGISSKEEAIQAATEALAREEEEDDE